MEKLAAATPQILRRDSLLIIGIAFLLFTIGLPAEFQALNARFALFAKEMLQNGPTFFPTAYNQPYPDYPGAPTFLIYLISLPFSKVTPFTATAPSAFAAALVLVLIYRLGSLHDRLWGLWAVILALFTNTFLSLARNIAPDMYVCLVTIALFYHLYAAYCRNTPPKLLWLTLLPALGFTFRGPIGFVIPAAVAGTFLLFNSDKKTLLRAGVSLAISFAICVALFFEAAKMQGGSTFIEQVIDWEFAGRLSSDALSAKSISYYWLSGIGKYAVSYPLALFVIAGRARKIYRRQSAYDHFLFHLVLWALVIMAGMSIPGVKKMRYIVAATPAFALLAAYLFVHVEWGLRLGQCKTFFLRFCTVLTVAAAALSVVALPAWRYGGFSFQPRLITSCSLMGAVVVTWWVLKRRFSGERSRAIIVVGAAAASFYILLISFSEPAYFYRNRSTPFIQQVEQLMGHDTSELYFFHIRPDSEALKFVANTTRPLHPIFVEDSATLLTLPVNAYGVARERDVRSLSSSERHRMRIVKRGLLDGLPYVVFQIAPQHDVADTVGMIQYNNTRYSHLLLETTYNYIEPIY